ncbi:DUF1127 domain-containing protein, partial [Mesorhizobium sp.]|uniref:DUF1127 domain-containing protein n=1 Tax=Mesorhizobium sp. TaxID=1871066 RepID=UPI0025CEDE92
RKALLSATDQLSRLPDDVLGDIGISRDEIMCALRSRAIRHSEAGAAGTTFERTCRSTLREPSATVAGVSLPVQKKRWSSEALAETVSDQAHRSRHVGGARQPCFHRLAFRQPAVRIRSPMM